MRTLCIHTGGIGDLLLACPALRRLSEEGTLEIAGRPERLAPVVAGGVARAAHDLDAVDFSSVFASPSARLRQFLAGFERVVVWMRDDDGRIVDALRACGVADARAYPGLPPEGWERHASEYYLECLGYPPDTAPFRLSIPATHEHDAIVHPGSGGRRKNWPLERFAELARALAAQGRRVAWSAGPAEEGMALPPGERIESGSLAELAGRLAGARLYLGNDSGVTHLAASVGCPAVAVFGPTEPRVWAPRGEHVRVVRGEPWPGVEEVLGAVRGLV